MKLFFMLLFLCSSALADFSGVWLGEFKFTNQKGETFYCEDLTIRINQQIDYADFGKFSYGCGQLVISFVPPKLVFDGSRIILKNKYNDGEVGYADEKEASVMVVVNDQGGKDRYHLQKLSNSEITYSFEQLTPEGETVTAVKAILKKQ